jgi:hypothetical protein
MRVMKTFIKPGLVCLLVAGCAFGALAQTRTPSTQDFTRAARLNGIPNSPGGQGIPSGVPSGTQCGSITQYNQNFGDRVSCNGNVLAVTDTYTCPVGSVFTAFIPEVPPPPGTLSAEASQFGTLSAEASQFVAGANIIPASAVGQYGAPPNGYCLGDFKYVTYPGGCDPDSGLCSGDIIRWEGVFVPYVMVKPEIPVLARRYMMRWNCPAGYTIKSVFHLSASSGYVEQFSCIAD